MSTFTTRYDICCDREPWMGTTLHCSYQEAMAYAHRIADKETGPIDVMTITKANHRVCVGQVTP